MSDFSDSDGETDTLDEFFTQAAEHVQRIHAAQAPHDLLELYALYKQATSGRCNTSKPGIFNMQARSKWNAWHDLGAMTQSEAKRLYVEKVRHLEPSWYEALQKGERLKSPNSWVVHSVHLPPPETEQKAEHEKNAFDHVKEGNLARLQESLAAAHLHHLDEHGMGLIHWATDRNAAEILRFLIAAGVDVNLLDAEQQTALHYAASCGHVDCVEILIQSKADRCIKDANGQTCIDVAETVEIRALLEF